MTSVAPNAGFRLHATRGAVVTGITQVYRIALNFMSGVLLARLLAPEDFGLIAMVSTCVAFTTLIGDLGLNQAAVQREKLSHGQKSAMFWMSLAVSAAAALAFAASAPLVAWFFGEPRLVVLTIAFAFLVLVSGSQSQLLALLNRDLRFNALASLDALVATVNAAVGITVAWLTSSYWALYAASLASALASLAFVWAASGFRPGKASFEGDLKDIVRFGSGVSGFNVINYFGRNADNLLIGRFYGSGPLGLYDRAYRLLLFPLSQILVPLGRVMLPVLARLQAEPDRYRRAYCECISLLMMTTQPGLVFAVVFAEDVFLMLLGPQWVPAAPIFRWLGVAGLVQVMTSTLGWLFTSQGRGGDFFKIGLFNGVVTVGSFGVGLPWGPLGVATSYTIANYALLLPAGCWSAGRRGPVRVRDLAVATAPHAAATVASAFVLTQISLLLPSPNLLACLALVTLSYAVYGLVMLAFPAKRQIIIDNLATVHGIVSSRAMQVRQSMN